jgi:poly-gamma-glutamate capsule biosynthesis protein CapA/YwtB (metallophosphatase superfamily)
VQGSEIYKGKYITYSLGNFIFDQEWSQGTKEGTVLESYFYGTRNVASNLAPILIEDFNQPRFLSDIEGRSIIERIKSVSLGL